MEKVTLYLNESEGDTLQIKEKICKVLNPEHIVFDSWQQEENNNSKIKHPSNNYHLYYIKDKGSNTYSYSIKAPNKNIAICKYVNYISDPSTEKMFECFSSVLTWEQMIAIFNNQYAFSDGDKILNIRERNVNDDD